MQSIYRDIQQKALEIASGFPLPVFYREHRPACDVSRGFFETDAVVSKLRLFVADHIENDFGHGMNHVLKVTIDAGALILIEGQNRGYAPECINRLVLIVQCAGLLHDIKRKHKNHAVEGGKFAEELLRSYPLTADEINDIRLSIRNHEAFKEVEIMDTPEGTLVSDCLYDADKFRWGPDNFTETVWDMLAFSETAIDRFVDHYPRSVEGLSRIKSTFRTPTGKKYGPQFIDLGISIGQVIYVWLKKTYGKQ
jgi:hypothetical protein